MITKQKYAGSRRAIALAAALMCVGSGLAFAQSAALPPPPKTNHWDTTAAAALTLTRGNSQTFLATVNVDTKATWEKDVLLLGASAGYGNSTVNNTTTKNTDFLQGYGQFNHLFSDRFYGALRLDAQYDGIADIDYRLKVSPMAGYYLIKNDKMMLAVEAGPSLISEHLDDQPYDAYWAFRAAERFEYKLTATTKVWETLEYLPKVDQWSENYLVNFEAGIDTSITKHWSLRVVLQDMYASEPAIGRKDNDIRLMAGTAYKF
jgi:putative salt-induced outer membrane protein YdiY